MAKLMTYPRPERLLYRVTEAAEIMGVSRSMVYELIWSGDLATVRVGKRAHRIPAAEIRRFITENTGGRGDDHA